MCLDVFSFLGFVLELLSSRVGSNLPIITSRKLLHPPLDLRPKQAWLETLSVTENEKLGIVDLHPEIFATFPRLLLIYRILENHT